MKRMIEKIKRNKDCLFVFTFISLIAFIFCYAKYGYFIDEIYTFGCSNSHYAPFVTMLNQGDINNSVLEKSDFIKYLTVDNNEIFDFGSVFYNLSYDTQPPLYFLFLNIASSLFQNVFSKWIGLGLNFLLYLLTLVVLYKICILLELEKKYSLAAVFLFGLSYSLLSNMLNIRMYILFACLSIILTYLFILYNKTGNKLLCILVILTVFLGAMTQYIFLVFAFFLTGLYFISFLIRKEWFKAILLGFSSLIGVVLLVAVFPTVLKIVFSGGGAVSGGGMMEQLLNVSGWPHSLISGARAFITGTFVSVSIIITVFLANLKNFKECFKQLRLFDHIDIILITITMMLTFTLVSIISPRAFNINYISNLSFVMPLLAAYLLYFTNKSSNKDIVDMSKILGIAVPVLMTISSFVVKPGYINGDFRIFDSILSNYTDSPCIYYQAIKNSPPISQDMAQLVQFKNVFVTDGGDYSLTADYINQQDKRDTLVVYVDVTERGQFQVNDILNYYLNELKYSSYKLLYKYECSECYAFTK